MKPNAAIAVLVAALALFGTALPAGAQPGILERLQSGLDDVARGFDYVGRKAEDLFGAGLGIGEERTADFTNTRAYSERYPTGPAPLVSVTNEFGEIRVSTWDQRVVEVSAEIVGGAESEELAAQLSQAIGVDVRSSEELVEISTLFPDTRHDMGYISMEVNYVITIPSAASLMIDNFFGDTIVRGVGGLLAVEAQYGLLDIGNIGGPIKARVHGEFPLKARGLEQGGVFQIHGGHAELSDVAGELRVDAFRGKLVLRDIAPDAAVDINSDSGSIHLILDSGEAPDLSATLLYGSLESDLDLVRTAQGNRIVARSTPAEAKQRITIGAAFSEVRIEQRVKEGETRIPDTEGLKPFNDVLTRTGIVADGTALTINATIGDIRIRPASGEEVTVTATRIVWVPAASKAPPALEALNLDVQPVEGQLQVQTVATEAMEALGNPPHRINLLVDCPPTVPVNVLAQDGLTYVEGLGGAVAVDQTAGRIEARSMSGALSLSNQKGDIQVIACTGPADVGVRHGALLLDGVAGAISANCVQGKTVVKSPGAGLTVRSSGGDVRILALEQVGGAYDVLVEQGDLSMLISPEADAELTVTAKNGLVDSAIPLSGSITRDVYEFRGRLKDGLHPVRLETNGGNIVLD